jgi:hypothetical protein
MGMAFSDIAAVLERVGFHPDNETDGFAMTSKRGDGVVRLFWEDRAHGSGVERGEIRDAKLTAMAKALRATGYKARVWRSDYEDWYAHVRVTASS